MEDTFFEHKVFTTGEAAQACRVSQQTIIRCFDTKLLEGFKVPGSRFRRIPRNNLLEFMKKNGIPTDLVERKQIVLIVAQAELRDSLKYEFDAGFETKTVWGLFETGMALKELVPSIIVVDCRTDEGTTIAQHIGRACAHAELIGIKYAAAVLENVTFTAVVTARPESTAKEIASDVCQRRAA